MAMRGLRRSLYESLDTTLDAFSFGAGDFKEFFRMLRRW